MDSREEDQTLGLTDRCGLPIGGLCELFFERRECLATNRADGFDHSAGGVYRSIRERNTTRVQARAVTHGNGACFAVDLQRGRPVPARRTVVRCSGPRRSLAAARAVPVADHNERRNAALLIWSTYARRAYASARARAWARPNDHNTSTSSCSREPTQRDSVTRLDPQLGGQGAHLYPLALQTAPARQRGSRAFPGDLGLTGCCPAPGVRADAGATKSDLGMVISPNRAWVTGSRPDARRDPGRADQSPR